MCWCNPKLTLACCGGYRCSPPEAPLLDEIHLRLTDLGDPARVDRDGSERLRRALKALLRFYGFRAESVAYHGSVIHQEGGQAVENDRAD